MLCFCCKYKALLRQRNAYEGNHDMFYKRTTEAKQKTFDIVHFFLTESHIISREPENKSNYEPLECLVVPVTLKTQKLLEQRLHLGSTWQRLHLSTTSP